MQPEFDPSSPWGRYGASGWQRQLIRCCQALPATRWGYHLNKGLRGPLKSAEPRYFDVAVLDLRLRLLTRGNYCETTALFAPQFYDTAELQWLKESLTGDSVFMDVGGNVGLYSLVAARNNSSTRVITVEPDTSLNRRMQFNAGVNGLNIESVLLALSNYEGSGLLDTGTRQSGQNQLLDAMAGAATAASAPAKSEQTKEVDVTTLTTLCQLRGVSAIDLMKIDIEGHEHCVLEHFLQHAPASLYPKKIIIEHVHDHQGTLDMLVNQGGYQSQAISSRNTLLNR